MIPLKPKLRRVMRWTTILSIVVVIYFLSAGPAMLLVNRLQMGFLLADVVFAPLLWAHKNTPLQVPISSYMGYFEKLDQDWDLPRCEMESAPRELLNAPNEVTISGKRILLEAHAFQRPDNAGRVYAWLRISTKDKSHFPGGIRADKAWVIQNGVAWIAQFDEPNDPSETDKSTCLVRRACGGPRWERGTPVDIVVQLRDDQGADHLVQLKNQNINMAYILRTRRQTWPR